METKWAYSFKEVESIEQFVNGDWEEVKGLLGGKGANLAEMARIGVPVPPGFTVTTEACNAYLEGGGEFPSGLWEQIEDNLQCIEIETGKRFGNETDPLLISCRSGAKYSMPGMMDTVLNIGLNDLIVESLGELTNDLCFAYDAYRRLIQMFGSVALEIDDDVFENILDEKKKIKQVDLDIELNHEDWYEVCQEFKQAVFDETGAEFPQNPNEQLSISVEAVFRSWNGKKAIDYRDAAGIPHDLGTAVSIVTMVFGNMGETSGTGVAFTRNPSTGEKTLFGDYLLNAQGEDVVAGTRTPSPISKLMEDMPQVYQDFVDICDKLEAHYSDMQDVEFTIEQGKLWMLQTRDGKRTAKSAIQIAVDMVNEGLISNQEAVMRISPEQVDLLLHPHFEPNAVDEAKKAGRLFCAGVNASPGAAVGRVYFDADTAERMALEENQSVIMVRPFTKPDDVHGMLAVKGILTSEGGATSHAAVVARQFGVPCVVGASAVRINLEERKMTVGTTEVIEGDWISVNGTTGEAYLGEVATITPSLDEQTELLTLLNWADEIAAQSGARQNGPKRGLEVWANADYPADARRARAYGAQGIGLCRTEHMFFETERLPIMQRMILAETVDERREALDELLPFQRADFSGLFEAMDGLPVIIRLIDPPLHEFLPDREKLLEEVITMKVKGEEDGLAEKESLLANVRLMHESNPMMGLRGVRLSILMPQIVEMQVRAIMEAAAEQAKAGVVVRPEVMIPLTGHVNELHAIQPRLETIAKEVMQEAGITFDYKFGTMIEIPRAALTAKEIAEVAEFFSFGTNDLTQMTFGYSRDDAEGNFLARYVEDQILPGNPFQSVDQDGVGRLMRMAVDEGRKARPDLEIGICGEHGGDPASIYFCHQIGLNYVSCSPFRIPVARLAAAQAALETLYR